MRNRPTRGGFAGAWRLRPDEQPKEQPMSKQTTIICDGCGRAVMGVVIPRC